MSQKNGSPTNSSPHPTLLVAGSAGFIGKHLTRLLADRGQTVVGLYRAHLPEPMAHNRPVFVDLLRKDHICTSLQGVNTVIQLAWVQSFSSVLLDQQYDNKDGPIPSRNLEIIKNLVQAMEEAGTQRIIFLSALGVSRHADSLYCQEKYQAEAMILNSKIPEKIILRSALAYSDISYRDRLVTAVESLMRFPWFYPVPRSKEKLAPIHVQDLSEMIWRLINQPMTCSAQILEVAGQQELSLEEVFRLVSKGVGKGTQVPLKGFLGEALTPIFERIYRNSRPNGPNLRELLTINKKRDPATSINGPFSTELNSLETHSFREAMKPVSQLIQ